jgi:DDE superfamily endonuclease
LGAVEPATGRATTRCSPRRDSASFLPWLEQVLQPDPARDWRLVADQLSPQVSRETQTALLAWPESQLWLRPKDACWLKLLEPWWQQRRRLALKGRRFAHVGEIIDAMVGAPA